MFDFLVFGLKRDEWVPVARNLATLLKPRGYLFWEETGSSTWLTLPPSTHFYKFVEKEVKYSLAAGRDITYESC